MLHVVKKMAISQDPVPRVVLQEVMQNSQKSMILRSVKVDREHIGYLKWLLESHDGLATPTTRQGCTDIVDFLVAPDLVEEFEELLEALIDELGLECIEPPLTSPL